MSKTKRIGIIVKSLEEGGAQKSAARLSIMLNSLDHEVYIVSLYNRKTFKYNGEFYALTTNNFKPRFFEKVLLLKKIKHIIEQKDFDYLIDFRGRYSAIREIIMNYYVFKNASKVIFTVRESKLKNALPNPFFLFKRYYQKAYMIQTVSKGIEKSIREKYNFDNIKTISNGIDIIKINEYKNEEIEVEGDFILAVGRLVKLKQFDKLIDLYSNSILPQKNIKLVIIGEGEEYESLFLKIDNLNLHNLIHLLPFQHNPYKYMSKAMFLVLCSKREGLPNVLIESLACDTPVISFDCVTGPSEIIKHKSNGLLVKDQDFGDLRTKIDNLLNNKDLYDYCKKNAKKSIEKYTYDNISKVWNEALNPH